jgi:hypothetical protein
MNDLNPATADLTEEVVPKERDLRDESFKNAVYQRFVVSKAMKEGTLACLPGADGYADTGAAVNIVNGTHYHGDTLLVLKAHAKEHGFPTAEYVTHAQLEKAKQDKPDLMIRKGEKGISIYFNSKNENGNYEIKTARLFNVAQTTKPWEIKDWAAQQQQKEEQRKLEYLKTQYGSNYQPPEKKQKEAGPVEIVCTSTEPAKYIGQYLAAVSFGSKFKVSQEQAAEFSKNMGEALFEKIGKSPSTGEPVTDPFKLSKISDAANKECVEIMKQIKMDAQKIDTPEQKREQTQGRGR